MPARSGSTPARPSHNPTQPRCSAKGLQRSSTARLTMLKGHSGREVSRPQFERGIVSDEYYSIVTRQFDIGWI
jgi:hypothetical protein